MAYLLITGITGLLGRYLLRDTLLDGRRVAVLARPTRMAGTHQRVEAVLAHWERELGRALPRPVVLCGNLCEPGLGLDEADRRWLARHCDSVLHSAASLVFHAEEPDGQPYSVNVQGTRHLVDLCQGAGIQNFHYISTAYVCGQRKGRVLEQEADPDAPFGNDYERSKSRAEQIVRSAFPETATIYRPSIILGDSRTGYTSNFRGFYTPLHLAYLLARNGGLSASRSFLDQLGMKENDGKNMVPVDWVSAVVVYILQHREHHGRTYHLTNPEPVTGRGLEDTILEALSEVLGDVGVATHHSASPAHTGLQQSMDIYRTYLGNDPQFDSAATHQAAPHLVCPRVDGELLLRLSRYALNANFSNPPPQTCPPELNIEDLLRPLLANSGKGAKEEPQQDSLQLELTGAGGGAWRTVFADTRPIRAEISYCGEGQAVLYGGSVAFRAVLTGQMSLDQAFLEGRLVLEVAAAEMSHAEQRVHSLLRFVRERLNAGEKRGQEPFVRSTHWAVPAKGS